MNSKENFLAAIYFQSPSYVPRGNEAIYHTVQFEGNFRIANWKDHWGVRWAVGIPDTVPFPKGNPLPDLERLMDYKIPDPDALAFTAHMKSALAKVDRGTQLIKGELTYLLFERAWAIMGMENFLTAFVTHPSEMHEFLHRIAHYARSVFDRYLELDVDAIGFSEDLGSQRALMVSPAMFRTLILPEYIYCFENVLRAGKIVHFHSCGCIDEIAVDLARIGVTILNPIQARANNLVNLKYDTIGRMALHGGIDTAILLRGTADEVRHEVGRVMEILKPAGGYICAPDQDIPGIPLGNMQALWETVERVGKY
jgi:uroporphyrinogen decarboxylase